MNDFFQFLKTIVAGFASVFTFAVRVGSFTVRDMVSRGLPKKIPNVPNVTSIQVKRNNTDKEKLVKDLLSWHHMPGIGTPKRYGPLMGGSRAWRETLWTVFSSTTSHESMQKVVISEDEYSR